MVWNLNIFSLIDRIILAVVILFIGFILGRVFGKVLLKMLHEAELNSWAQKIHIKFSLEELLSKSIEIVFYIITIFLVLKQLGIENLVFSVILIFINLIIIVSIILGIRDFIPNYFAGLKIKNKLKVGSSLRFESIKGIVEKVGLVEVTIITSKGDMLLMPYYYLKNIFNRR